MPHTISKFIHVTVVLTVVTFMMVAGCSNQPAAEPPEVPPPSTMQIEFDDFADGTAARVAAPVDRQVAQLFERQNWGFAAGNLVVWNTVLSVTLVVPVTAFAESFNHEPEQQDDGSWVWSYDVLISGVNHSAALSAIADGGDIRWEMLLSKEGAYTDFSWFTGVSNLLATEGTWTLNLEPDDPVEFLFIEWQRNPGDDTAQVRYTNVTPDVPGNADYIVYGVTTDETYDAFYDIFDNSAENLTEIEWTRQTKVGRAKDQDHFADSDWHCWDEELLDTDCPSP